MFSETLYYQYYLSINIHAITSFFGVGEPERFGPGHESFNNSRALALIPVKQKAEQNVTQAFIVDLDRNSTIGKFSFADKAISYDQMKTLINLTVDAPIVKDSFWDYNLMFITADYSKVIDTAPGYINWSGRFVTVSISMDDPFHLNMNAHHIDIVIDDTVPRIIGVSDWFSGLYDQYSPVYAVIPPGKEKFFNIAHIMYSPPIQNSDLWWTRVNIEPRDAKVYPLIFEANNTPKQAFVYKDFITNDTTSYAGNKMVCSGWSANISLNHDAHIHMILKNPDPSRDVEVEVDIAPDRQMMDAISRKFR